MSGTGAYSLTTTRRHRFGAGLAALLLLVGGLVPSLQAQAPREVVSEVRVAGNRNVATDRVLKMVRTRVGNDFSTGVLMEDVDRLYKSRLFKVVRPREQHGNDGRVVVTFDVVEFPNLIADIQYKNCRSISQGDLEKTTGLRKGMPLDPAANRRACFDIQDLLKSKGRFFANVSLEEGDQASDRRVIFNITEGPIVRVRNISFQGNEQLATGARLKTQMDSRQAFVGMFGGVFQPAAIESDAIKLEEYYKANGYLDVRVTRELKFSEDQQYVDVIYHINEGRRYQVETVVTEGVKKFPADQIKSIVQLKEGDWYNEGTVQADVRNITDFYGWRGTPAGVQKQVFTVPGQPGVVRVQYQVAEAPPAKVGQVIIVGNEVTQDRVIRRVLGLYPGQTLRYPEMRLAERELSRLNIFEVSADARPTLTVLDSDSEYKDVLVQVKETTTGSLLFGAGVNSDNGLVGSIVLNERNFDIFRFPTSIDDVWAGRAFRGAGQELRVEAVPGTELQRYSVTFREPYLFDRPLSLTTSGYYRDNVFLEYIEGRMGGRVNVAKQLTRKWSINGGFRAENVNVSSVPFYAPQDYFSVSGNNFLVAPRIGVSYDTRDSYLRPTEGGTVEASYEQVFGDFNFPILSLEGNKYYSFFPRQDGSGKHVLALRGTLAWAGDDAPVFERFFGGGYRSIRGFEYRGMGPTANGLSVGGQFMMLASAEYQIPVMANDNLYLVGFVDTGTVERNFEITDYRVSVGAGLRIVVPMLGPVPIALDFGFPIRKADTDREQIFSFWVGLFR